MPMMEKERDRFLFSVSELSANKVGGTRQRDPLKINAARVNALTFNYGQTNSKHEHWNSEDKEMMGNLS